MDAAFSRGPVLITRMLVKNIRDRAGSREALQPADLLGAERTSRFADGPIPSTSSTSYVESQNLSMRMGMRRFTRLTNAFSKKLENHMHALSIYFMHYNFVRIHQTLRCYARDGSRRDRSAMVA